MGLREYLKKREQRHLGEDRYILCLDGGGMRGVIPATILGHIEHTLHSLGDDRPLYSHFDLVAGTSTGGLIALALTAPDREGSFLAHRNSSSEISTGDAPRSGKRVPAAINPGPDIKRLADIYRTYGRTIFPKSQSIFQLNMINQLFTQKYDDGPFNQVLADIFGEQAIGDALTPTMVVTYDFENDRAHILSSYASPAIPAKVAARATSAAPIYFSPASIIDAASGKRVTLIDGGVIANNPVLYAYREAKRLYPEAKLFHVLSLSTGNPPYALEADKTGSGVIGWLDPSKGAPIYRIYASSQMRASSDIASVIGDLAYVRIHGNLERKIKLDETDPAVLARMIDTANSIFSENQQTIIDFCSPFTHRRTNPPRPIGNRLQAKGAAAP